ncbi:hypothetical protein ACF0H5_021567 [Mactra antiquata]
MLRLILIWSSVFYLACGICPNDWVRYEGSCYYFADLPKDRVTWQVALQRCLSNESSLVVVETKAENDFIKSHLAQLHPQTEDQFWTLGNDLDTENTWMWGQSTNSVVAPFTTTFWYPGEPNQNGGEEDCLSFYTRYNFAWNDEHCDRPEYYICEIMDSIGEIIG